MSVNYVLTVSQLFCVGVDSAVAKSNIISNSSRSTLIWEMLKSEAALYKVYSTSEFLLEQFQFVEELKV